MAMPNNTPENGLCDEILAEARHQSAEILEDARQEAESTLNDATSEAEGIHRQQLEQSRREADRRRELVLAAVPVETRRLQSARIEALLQSIREELRRRLGEADGFDLPTSLAALAGDAIRRMSGDHFIIQLSEADQAVLQDGFAKKVCRIAGRHGLEIAISPEPLHGGPGLIVRDRDGHQIWDNRLLRRLDRLWPALRREIAQQTSLLSSLESASEGEPVKTAAVPGEPPLRS